jgi:ParB-like chromosome segregation protein Spo0J
MLLSFKNEDEMRKVGIMLDPCNPSLALPIAKRDDRQQIVWDDAASVRDCRTRTKEDRRATADPRRPGSPIPDLSVAEYNSLKELIHSQGVRVPIIVDQDGKIIDGVQRDRICKELGIDCPRVVQQFASEAERLQVAIALNIPRRHWTRHQRRGLIAAYLKVDPAINDNELGDIVGVSKNTVASVRGELEATCQIDKLEQRRGRDGKNRPAKYRQILATTPKEAEEAQTVIKSLPSSGASEFLGPTNLVLPEEASGKEIDEHVADDISQAQCPFCKRRFPLQRR